MNLSPDVLAALIVGVSFAAGLNVYATLLTLGVLARFHWVLLPAALHAVASPWVMGMSAVLFALEFVADKIPAFDLLWNAAQTFVRIPVAALLAYGAAQHLSPGQHVLVTLLGAGVAAVAHGSKLAVRGVVTPSPEPLSNIALSVAEDGGAITLTWLATHHPVASAVAVGALCAVLLLAVRTLWLRLAAAWRRAFEPARGPGA